MVILIPERCENMARRGDNIRKRKDGRWEGRYKIGKNKNGQTQYKSIYGLTYNEVKSKLKKITYDMEIKDVYSEEKHTFAYILQKWQNTNRIKHKSTTEDKYKRLIEQHIVPEIGYIYINDLSTEVINTFLEKKLSSGRLDRKGGLSPSYVRTLSIIIKSALQYAVEENYCAPFKHSIYKPQPQKKELKILSQSSQKEYINYLTTNMCNVNIGILLSLYAGLRIGEVCALQWKNIDINEQIIHIHSTVIRVKNSESNDSQKTVLMIDRAKTEASVRNIPIASILIPLLKEYKADDSSFVLTGTSSFLSPRTFEYKFHRTLHNCGIEQINYHALRHTFATRCIERGVDIKTLSEILGHSDVAITLRTYVHSSMELKKMQIEKLSV